MHGFWFSPWSWLCPPTSESFNNKRFVKQIETFAGFNAFEQSKCQLWLLILHSPASCNSHQLVAWMTFNWFQICNISYTHDTCFTQLSFTSLSLMFCCRLSSSPNINVFVAELQTYENNNQLIKLQKEKCFSFLKVCVHPFFFKLCVI